LTKDVFWCLLPAERRAKISQNEEKQQGSMKVKRNTAKKQPVRAKYGTKGVQESTNMHAGRMKLLALLYSTFIVFCRFPFFCLTFMCLHRAKDVLCHL